MELASRCGDTLAVDVPISIRASLEVGPNKIAPP
jgi:hypothetical protein